MDNPYQAIGGKVSIDVSVTGAFGEVTWDVTGCDDGLMIRGADDGDSTTAEVYGEVNADCTATVTVVDERGSVADMDINTDDESGDSEDGNSEDGDSEDGNAKGHDEVSFYIAYVPQEDLMPTWMKHEGKYHCGKETLKVKVKLLDESCSHDHKPLDVTFGEDADPAVTKHYKCNKHGKYKGEFKLHNVDRALVDQGVYVTYDDLYSEWLDIKYVGDCEVEDHESDEEDTSSYDEEDGDSSDD